MSRFGKLRRRLLSEDPRCVYCGEIVTIRNSSIDHVVPRASGGVSTQNNLVLTCKRCNQRKADLSPQEIVAWARRVASVHRVVVAIHLENGPRYF
jgi:5-methylcytosine-specific restriction endonuclease McrA